MNRKGFTPTPMLQKIVEISGNKSDKKNTPALVSGFTLIELLVVIAIIGILATVVLASLGQARTRSQNARTQTDLNQIKTVVVGGQVGTNQTVLEMTGNICSQCSCPTSTDLSGLSASHSCVSTWRNAIDAITADYSPGDDGSVYYEDVWGSPFLLDENEGELSGNPCRRDTLTSAGADRIAFTADDVTIVLPFETC